ncbi:peptide/nickel transport system substrate-binding protein [Humitalea rosea]|uniref:Peptide/nickel transport system substrate-binding protein n=1 Tax=Humitalea rosea TaxID=990373 RepID=A0A2W7IQI9_9PROT|nr:ABC transporter substrate-binding protein [Humitalea rosea]PZW48138.1 peptide/nickel transport system substrate-binding protein [Humitalea rosea]
MLRLILLLLAAATVAAQAQSVAIIAVGADPGQLNPAISTAGPAHTVADTIFSGLVTLDEDGTARPDLARSWAATDGPAGPGTIWRFALDPSARWHDGTPFSSADVVYTFTEVLFRYHARARAGLAPAVAAIEAPDPHTVVFRLSRPNPAFLAQLDVTEAPILPQHLYAGTDPRTNPVNGAPIGTGPFRFVAHRHDDRVVLERVSGHGFDRLLFRIIADPTLQAAALLRGEVDYLARVALKDAARLAAMPDVTLHRVRGGPGGSNCVMTLAFNMDRVALPLRRALALAVDREAMLHRFAYGQGGVSWGLLSSGLGDFPIQAVIPAADRVPEAPPRLDIVAFASFRRWVEALQADFARIGITARSRLLDPAATAEAVFARRDFDLSVISYCHGPDPEIGARRLFDSAAIGVPFGNAAGFHAPEVDALLAEASASPEHAERVAAWRDIQARALAELPYWPLVEVDLLVAWRNTASGWAPWSGRFADRARPAGAAPRQDR